MAEQSLRESKAKSALDLLQKELEQVQASEAQLKAKVVSLQSQKERADLNQIEGLARESELSAAAARLAEL